MILQIQAQLMECSVCKQYIDFDPLEERQTDKLDLLLNGAVNKYSICCCCVTTVRFFGNVWYQERWNKWYKQMKL